MLSTLKGNPTTASYLLWILGWAGIILAIFSHLQTWRTFGADVKVKGTGLDSEYAYIALGVLAIYALLLLLKSVYTILFALIFGVYVLEQVIGLHFLRYMPFESTKLTPAVYLFLPTSSLLLFLGAFASILMKFQGK
jgi:hypothetical protein